jgi:hypothetical protein
VENDITNWEILSFLLIANVAALKDSLKGFSDGGYDGRLVNCSLDVSKPVQECPAGSAADDGIVGWATQIDRYGRTALAALNGDFDGVATHR